MRRIVADLFEPNRWFYWVDFLLCSAVAWTAVFVALRAEPVSWEHLAAVLVASFAFYRGILFTHELVHVRRGALPGFRIVWNILCGIPLMVPNFLYLGVYVAHHSKTIYGTRSDGEYLPFATRKPTLILRHFLLYLVQPLAVFLRFAIVAPISVIRRKTRIKVMRKLSSQSLRVQYTREIPTRKDELRSWTAQEIGAFSLGSTLLIATLLGYLPWAALGHWYVIVFLVFVYNGLRALGATHRYRTDEKQITFEEQITDSVTVTGNLASTFLICPVGLRYHALHHLFPTIPYHSLGEAHRRLWRQLPENAAYRGTGVRSVWEGCALVWRDAAAHVP